MRDVLAWLWAVQDKLRITRPRLWHLRTAYVLPLSLVGCLLAIAAAFLVTVDDKSITAVEPIFFAALAALILVTQFWFISLSKPLRPVHTATLRREPGLIICTLHAMLVVAPAFCFGTVLEYRTTSKYPLSDVLTWRSILSEFMSARVQQSSLALITFGKALAPDAMPRSNRSIGIDLDQLNKEHGIPGLRAVADIDGKIDYVVPVDDLPLVRSCKFFQSEEAALLLKKRGPEAVHSAMDALFWCRLVGAVVGPLAQRNETPAAPQTELGEAIVRAASASGKPADSRQVRDETANRLRIMATSVIGGISIQDLRGLRVNAEGGFQGNLLSSPLVFADPKSDKPQPDVELRCMTFLDGVLIELQRKVGASRKENDFERRNDIFIKQIIDKVNSHAVANNAVEQGLSIMQMRLITDEVKPLVKAFSDSIRNELRQMSAALQILNRIAYIHAGLSFDNSATSSIRWPSDWYWYGSRFPQFGTFFLLASVSFIILCWRSAPNAQFQAGILISGTLFVALLWSAFAEMDNFHIAIIATAVACGAACCSCAAVTSTVSRLHKIGCMASGIAIPVLSYFLFRYFLQSCVGAFDVNEGPPRRCESIGRTTEHWNLYVAAAIILFIAIAELFLVVWRRIVVKPSG